MDDFPDPDEEYDLVPVEVHNQSSKNVAVPAINSQEKQLQKPVFNGKGQTLVSKDDGFPNFDEEFDVVETNSVQTTTQHNNVQSTVNGSSTDNSRKRNFDELCSDVAHLLGDDYFSSELFDDYNGDRRDKRPRWDQPNLVIEAIRNKKMEIQYKFDNDEDSPHIFNSVQPDKKEDSISLRIPPWNFVPLTRYSDSLRLYVRVRPESNAEPIKIKSASGLLSMSYEKLKEEAEKILLEKRKYDDLQTEPTTLRTTSNAKIEDTLWVDKYRPQKYMELLTDETVNRDFLRWLKSWDKVVFNREPIRHKQSSTAAIHQQKKFGGNPKPFFAKNNVQTEFIDDRGFPVYRVALLSGPPGLGKTTLAHLVARHAGYNVVEINASDDRSPEAFRQALLSSTQMKSMIGADPRPNCLVLDEIDGAPAASIELLLKFIQGKLNPKGKKAKSGDKKSNECKRPIVCICNELYSAALRPLRAMAYVINVPKVDSSSLADRLMTVARREKINVDQGTLLQLAERCGCDVRSCLNALQYMREDCEKSNTSLGIKDTKKGLFEFWRDILQIPLDKNGPLSNRSRAQLILKSAYSNNTERIMQGVFENYPNNCHDKMTKLSKSIEWFQFYDQVSTVVMTRNDWQVMPYTNHAFVSWHLGFALPKNPKLNFPYAVVEVQQKLNKNLALVTATQRTYGRDVRVIVLDIASLLFELLTPKLRSVASNLYSTREKEDLERLLNVMLDLGLSLVQEKKDDGTVDYELEPNLYEIGIFPDCKLRRGLSYTVKQVIVQELEIARLKRAAIAIGVDKNDNTKSNDSKKNQEKVNDDVSLSQQDSDANFRPNHLDAMARIVVPETIKERQFKDFFKNFKLPKPAEQNSSQASTSTSPKGQQAAKKLAIKNKVWFKYKEGYSNAVRRTVRIKDIL